MGVSTLFYANPAIHARDRGKVIVHHRKRPLQSCRQTTLTHQGTASAIGL